MPQGTGYEVRAGFITNSAAVAAVTVSPGDSFVVHNFTAPGQATLESLLQKRATAGTARVRSTLLHDNTQGIRMVAPIGSNTWDLGWHGEQALIAQDTLTVEANSGAADSTIVGVGAYYQGTAGLNSTFIMPGDVVGNIAHLKPILVTQTTSATIGTWTDTALNATEDLTRANQWYAVLGYITDVACGLVGIKGLCTNQLRSAGPGTTDSLDTSEYFLMLSQNHGHPHIPVFNAADKANTFVSTADNTASLTVNVTLLCALLKNVPNL